MLTLAAHYDVGLVAAGQIADDQKLSLKYLESLLRSLKSARLIVSKRGTQGGYSLARPPAEISLYDVLTPLETAIDIVHCTEDWDSCGRSGTCGTQEVWQKLRDAVETILCTTSLADLLERQKTLDRKNARSKHTFHGPSQ
ncbi:Rrf2 family transcriptional regulator [bacterium]|nr:Rrf2 family transcriptional regulator [bacterium]